MKKITEPEDIADKVVSRWEGEGGSVPEPNEIRPDSDLTEQ